MVRVDFSEERAFELRMKEEEPAIQTFRTLQAKGNAMCKSPKVEITLSCSGDFFYIWEQQEPQYVWNITNFGESEVR